MPLLAPFIRWISRVRFPWLVGRPAAMLLVNLVLPDPIPFVGEIILALATALSAPYCKRSGPSNWR